jgi:hypothetical protein
LLHRLGFVDKKPTLVPGKADPEARRACLAKYEDLKKNKAPNLNPIERLWKLFKKTTLYTRYCESFGDFRNACEGFFDNSHLYRAQMRSLLTESFAIVGE